MNKFKNGWTMAELVVAMMVLAVLMLLSLQIIKPKQMRVIPFAYAAVKNLSEGARFVIKDIDDGTKKLPDGYSDIPVANSNKSCVALAEAFSLTGSYNCVKDSSTYPAIGKGTTGSPNFQTANLITYSGLEKDFSEGVRGNATSSNQCGTASVDMKDIMVDINGDEGENKVGIDQFPLKLLKTGEVIPGTCSDIESSATTLNACAGKTYDSAATFKKHPTLCGILDTKFINEPYPFAYTVYRVRKPTDAEIASGRYNRKSRITEILKTDDGIMAEISFAHADCLARNNILTRLQCEKLGYEPADECITNGTYCLVRQSRPLSMNLFAVPF